MSDAVRNALELHRDELIGFARERAGHLVDPEDIVHRAAVRALAAADRLRDPASARAWLFRIVRNELASELRGIGLPVAELPDDLADPAGTMPSLAAGPCQCALKVTEDLRPEYATIISRTIVEEVPVIDVARELGITANNANVRLHRARKALREAVQRHCNTSDPRDCAQCTC